MVPATTMRSGQSVGTARGAIVADSRTSAALGRAAPAPSPALKYNTCARVRKRKRPQPELPTNAKRCGPRALTGWGVREKASADSRSEIRILTAVAHAAARIILEIARNEVSREVRWSTRSKRKPTQCMSFGGRWLTGPEGKRRRRRGRRRW